MYKKLKKIFFKSTLLILVLFFLASRTVFFKSGTLENIASKLAYPALVATSKIITPLKKYFTNIKKSASLEYKIAKLVNHNEQLLKENIQLKATLHHKELTNELVTFQARYNLTKGIFAKILTKNIDDTEHFFLLNKGSRDGIRKNMVLIYKFQLVGRVSEVFSCHSKVALITDQHSKVAAYTNNTNAQGIVLGKNQPNKCHLTYVNHLSTVEKDDFVLSSGQGLVFPEGFCLGRVIKHETKKFCHNIEIEPLVDFSKLEFGILLDRSLAINL